MSIFKIGLLGKSPPGKIKDIMNYLTRSKVKNTDLPDVFPASQAPIPKVKEDVAIKDAINRFVRDNPRTEKAGGGMLVQPSADGSRPGYKEEKYISPSNILKNIDIPEKTKQKYVTLLKGINKWKKDPSAENWVEIFRRGDGLNQTQESLNVRRYITGKPYQGKELFPQVKEHFDKMNLKQIIGPDVELIKDYTPEYFKKTRALVATQASAVAKLAKSADEVREIAQFFKRAKDPKKLNVLNLTKKLIPGYNSLNEYDQIAALENVSNRVSRYLEFLEGTREVGKLKKPQNAKEIISFIKSNMSDFEFGTSTIRNMKFSARDAALGLERGTTRNTRAILYDLKEPGTVIDEVAGLSATYKRLPGYTGLTQIIDADINQLKNTKIDIPFSSKYLDEILKGDFTNVANHNREARIFMRANPGVKIPLIVTGENLDPSKHIKYFTSLLPEEQKNIKQIAKKNKFVLKTDALPIKNLIATLGGDNCGRRFKNQGGRVGLQDGTPSVDVCFRNGLERIRKGGVDFTRAEAMNFNKLTKGLRAVGASSIMKLGVIPEVLFEGALIANKMATEGDSFAQGLRNSYLAIPFQAMGLAKTYEEGKKDEILAAAPESQRGKILDVMNLQDTLNKRNELVAQSQNLKSQIEDTDRISDGSFGYVGDSQDLQKKLFETRADLQDLYRGDARRAERMLTTKPIDLNIRDQLTMDAYKSAVEKADVDRASNILFAPGANLGVDTQIKKRMKDLPITPEYAKEQLKATGDFFGTGYTPFGMNELFESMGVQNPRFGYDETGQYSEEKGLNDFMNYLKNQQVADAGGVANLAGGGIAKLAGVDQGPPPESGPMSQGLQGLMKRGIKG